MGTNDNEHPSAPNDDFRQQEAKYGIAMSPPDIYDGDRDVFATAPVQTFKYYVLGHIYAGEGRLLLANEKLEMRLPAGSVVILKPGTPNIYGSVSGDDYREDYVFFAGSGIDRMLRNGLLTTGCHYYGVTRRLPEIAALLRNPSAESQFRARLLFQEFLLEIHSLSMRRPQKDRLSQLLSEISAHPEKWWTVDDMAAFCKCSSAQLRRNFRDATGMLPKHYVERLKLQLAAERLACTDDAIMEICLKLGYTDRFHFSRRFTLQTGLSPARYRRTFQHKKNAAM